MDHASSGTDLHCASCSTVATVNNGKYAWSKVIAAAMLGLILMLIPMFFPNYFPALVTATQLPFLRGQIFWLVIAAICLGVMIYSGGRFYTQGLKELLHGRFSMNILIALGTSAAWIYSVIVVICPTLVPEASRYLYFDTSVWILAFITLGQRLEEITKGKASLAIQSLLHLQPKTATVIRDQQEQVLPLAAIRRGDLIRVKTGEQIPVDGIVTDGFSEINESMLTGEPMPVPKQVGSLVYAGTINQMGSFVFRAESVGETTVLAKITHAVNRAQAIKPKIGRLVDRVVQIFVPIVILVAIITALAWSLFAPEPKLPFVLTTSIAVLLIACPCALGMATPISLVAGIGQAALRGILVRNGDALEKTCNVTHVLLDKTGTITKGVPLIAKVIALKNFSEEKIMQMLYSLEKLCEHPLAKAVIHYVETQPQKLKALDVKAFEMFGGKGLHGKIGRDEIYVGTARWFKDLGITINTADFNYLGTLIYIAVNGELVGVVVVADQIRSDSVEAVQQLHQLGLKVFMVTGDNHKNATEIGEKVGVDRVVAEVFPRDKQKLIQELQNAGYKIAMVGDGINDAPALAQAYVSLAMSSGSDIAIETADMTLLHHSLKGVADAIWVSKKTMQNIRQNLWGAMLYNSLGIPLAAGVLYPFFHILLSPIVASVAMALSSLSVVLNALRLRLYRRN